MAFDRKVSCHFLKKNERKMFMLLYAKERSTRERCQALYIMKFQSPFLSFPRIGLCQGGKGNNNANSEENVLLFIDSLLSFVAPFFFKKTVHVIIKTSPCLPN